ncbi:hypothetical protein NHQ30_002206 [Ciborinia camelliae]|nr:hypothetical protein NHQ30_002206 [Ciborinia camelliae]
MSSKLAPLDLNHFICTLGEAKIKNLTPTSQYDTINDFLDYQSEKNEDQIAVAIPERRSERRSNHANTLRSHRPDYVEAFDGNGPEEDSNGESASSSSSLCGGEPQDSGYISPDKRSKKVSSSVTGVVATETEVEPPAKWIVRSYNFRELRDFSLKLAHTLNLGETNASGDKFPYPNCVGLLGRSDRAFLLMWLALMRIGVSVLIIMPSCSSVAIQNLCKKCNVGIVFYDFALQKHHAEASKLMDVSGPPFQMRGYSMDYIHSRLGNIAENTNIPFRIVTGATTAYHHHTSGTTGFPKPVPYSHHTACGALPILDGRNTMTFTTTPLYTGGIADCLRAWTSLSTICLAPDCDYPLTSEMIIECCSEIQNDHRLFIQGLPDPGPKSMYFSCVPMIAQMLSQTAEGLAFLRTMNIVGVGGAPLPKKDGDFLVSQGINLASRFGSAECSFVLTSHRHYKTDKDWEYLRIPNGVPHLEFEPSHDGTRFELVIKKDWPQLAKKNREDGSFETGDLFEPHPKIMNAWKHVGRKDAQITLLTGKKFDPVCIEETIKMFPLVQDAFIFGNSRMYPGAIIIKSKEAAGMEDEHVRDKLWPYFQKLNKNSPTHAKIFKDMLVLKPNNHFLAKTAKGTTRRQQCEQFYDTNITAAYESYESAEAVSNSENLLETVMGIVEKAIGSSTELQYDSDFRAHNIDSVQATRIVSRLNSTFSNESRNKCFPWNLVYECGSVRAVAEYIKASKNGLINNDDQDDVRQMISIVERFGKSFRDDTCVLKAAKDKVKEDTGTTKASKGNFKEIIIITGVTGTLGANILSLLQTRDALRIICFVRAKNDKEANERVKEALRYHSIHDQDPIPSTTKIEYIAVKLDQTELGLSRNVLLDLREHATTIIHAAWEVNFSIPLKDFTEQFQGLRNLINFSLSGTEPKHLVFCSSTASVANATDDTTVENTIIESIDRDPLHAGPLGYSRSKWVAEAICSLACQKTRANISILRIGQLAGNTVNGTWNEKEAWPLMLSTGGPGCLNSLPELDLPLSWLPVDKAAEVIIDIAFRKTHESPLQPPSMPHEAVVFHVLNDSTSVTWKHLLKWIGHEKKTVEFGKWLRHAELPSPKGLGDDHPARSLLGFWKAMDRKNKEEFTPMPSFGLLKTRQVSSTMNTFSGIDEQLVKNIWHWVQTVAQKWENEKSDESKKRVSILFSDEDEGISGIATKKSIYQR